MRFTGHLDLRKTWERTFRRAGLPLAYSQGYTAHPQLNMASPLPLGVTSCAELGDFWLSQALPPEDIQAALEESVPPGLEVHQVEEIEEIHGDKLPVLIQASEYTVDLLDAPENLAARVTDLINREEVPRTRRGKAYDLRKLIHSLVIDQQAGTDQSQLRMVLATLPGATGRPDEVIDQLEVPRENARITRTKIFLSENSSK